MLFGEAGAFGGGQWKSLMHLTICFVGVFVAVNDVDARRVVAACSEVQRSFSSCYAEIEGFDSSSVVGASMGMSSL